MALILETGAGLPNAESLITTTEARTYATSRGYTLPAADADLEEEIRKAHDYLLGREGELQGERLKYDQGLPYPREGVYLFGTLVASNVIPLQLKNAVCQMVCDGQSLELMPTSDGRIVTQEVVGPLSTTYSDQGASATPESPRVDALLAPFLKSGGGGMSLSSLRV
jgi:hypothetical protein